VKSHLLKGLEEDPKTSSVSQQCNPEPSISHLVRGGKVSSRD
jgi:hypothetical protein